MFRGTNYLKFLILFHNNKYADTLSIDNFQAEISGYQQTSSVFRDVTDGNTVITFMVGSAIHIVQRLANLLLIYEDQRKSSTFFNERDEIGRDYFDVQVFYSLLCLHFMVQLETLLISGTAFTLFRHGASNKQSSIGPNVFFNICKTRCFSTYRALDL